MTSAARLPIRVMYRMATARHMTELGMAEIDRRLAYLRTQCAADTMIDISVPKEGPGSIESRTDAALSVPELLRGVEEAEGAGYDGVVLSCFGDPGLDAARELVRIPVVASGQSSMHVAAQLGARFSILSPRDGAGSRVLDGPRRYGFHLHYASTRGTGLSVMDLNRDRGRTVARLAEVGRACIEQDGADTLVLGCLSMAFHDVAREVSAELGVPVVNPVSASIAFIELLVRAGISHSRLAYPPPPQREFLR